MSSSGQAHTAQIILTSAALTALTERWSRRQIGGSAVQPAGQHVLTRYRRQSTS
jgi:hypothetical protein